jgi:hypothetical protein
MIVGGHDDVNKLSSIFLRLKGYNVHMIICV